MNTKFTYLKLAIAVLLTLLVSVPALAATDQAKVTKITGQADYKKAGGADFSTLKIGDILNEGDAVKTGAGSEVTMELVGKAKTAEIVVRESSKFVFKTFQHDADATDTTLLDVSLGAVLVKAEKLAGDSKFEVKTPTSIVGIRGTTFEVKVAK